MAEKREARVAHELAVCQVCKAGALNPRLLPCLHAVCSTCLEKLLRQGTNQGCPTCHVTLEGVQKVKDLPANNLAQTLLERNERDLKGLGQLCTACSLDGKKKEKSMATVWCTACTEYYCEKCNRIHQQVKSDKKNHEVVRISQLRKPASFRNGNTIFKKSKEMCSTHPKEAIRMFCDQCEEPICEVCEKDEHRDHPYLPIEGAASDYRAEIKNTLTTLEDKYNSVQTALDAWNVYATEVDKSEKQTLENIDEYANELISLVQSWHKQCLSTLHSATEKEREEIENKKEAYTGFRSSLETAMLYGQRLLTQGQDGFVTYVKKNVVTRLQDLNEVKIENPGKTFSFSFQKTPNVETAKIFGTLSVEQDDRKPGELFIMKDFPVEERKASDDSITSFKATSVTDRLAPWLTGVSCSDKGDIILADHRNNVLKLFTETGTFKRSIFVSTILTGRGRFTGPSQSLWDCAWLQDGTIVTASVDGLHVFNINSELVSTLDDVAEYTSVTVTPSGDIVSYNDTKGHVVIYHASSRKLVRSFSVYEKHSIGWISKVGVDHHGNILVCDVNKDSIKVFAPTGHFILEIGSHGKGDGQFIRIRGVCSDETGNLIAADKGNHRIQKLSLNGSLLKNLMTKAEGLDSPSSVTLFGKTKAVAVTDNGFVHVLPLA